MKKLTLAHGMHGARAGFPPRPHTRSAARAVPATVTPLLLLPRFGARQMDGWMETRRDQRRGRRRGGQGGEGGRSPFAVPMGKGRPKAARLAAGLLGLLMASGGVARAASGEGLPPGWDAAPGNLSEFPSGPCGAILADPWSYEGRLGMYKTLMGATPALAWGEEGEGHPLWGLPLQFAWQRETGRLFGDGGDVVSKESWWAGMNYMLSVVPFVAAMEAGAITVPWPKSFVIEPAPGFCTTFQSCSAAAPRASAAWREFFRWAVEEPEPALEKALELLWRAHAASLHDGLPLMSYLLDHLPSARERSFGLQWANLVDFIAALRYDVDFNHTNFLQGLIVPPRLLRDSDRPGLIHDFTPAQNRGLLVAELVSDANRGGLALRLWQQACCTPSGRKAATRAAVGLLEHPLLDLPALVDVLIQLAESFPSCKP